MATQVLHTSISLLVRSRSATYDVPARKSLQLARKATLVSSEVEQSVPSHVMLLTVCLVQAVSVV